MAYYVIGLRLEEPLKSQFNVICTEFLKEMNIDQYGKLFLEPYTNPLSYEKFNKLLDVVTNGDTLIFYDLSRTFEKLSDMYEMLKRMYIKKINFVNIAVSNINSIDNHNIYNEIAWLLPAIHSYTTFLEAIFFNKIHQYNFQNHNGNTEIPPQYNDFISHTIRVCIKRATNVNSVDDFFVAINKTELKNHLKPILPEIEYMCLDSSYLGLNSHMQFMRGEYYIEDNTL